ncbi:MAG: hypothetical protein HQK86_12095 [Nitrospinae bacterium]|nr:hypothetical protein [Nitrospinota bacterium]MBF0635042.1 hypothetical protein [Nitrospinota bacterium]
MKYVGRTLTEDEADRVRAPFSRNAGGKWDIEKATARINAGADRLEADGKAMDSIREGVKKLGQ